jgi:class 3 adenylate cyclase/pimeloyl-ACP methyl ester carboxylesterase
MEIPDTKYAKAGDAAVAYQVYGSGEHKVVAVPGIVSNCELIWEWPPAHHFLERWGSFATVAHFDKRGTGCSDRIAGVASVEERMEDFHVVMDAVGWDRATIYGLSEGAAMACLFAATYPERTERLILQGGFARIVATEGYEFGLSEEFLREFSEQWAASWGTPETLTIPFFVQSQLGDEAFLRWFNRFERLSSTPSNLFATMMMNAGIDVRHVLPTIQVPTLVVHARQDLAAPIVHGRYLADHIPGAEFFEYDGEHMPSLHGVDECADAIERFITGTVRNRTSDRVLATVLFTDICDSTARAASVGDQQWRGMLDSHDDALRGVLNRHGGVEVNTTGDGLLATFDSPARAVRCAAEMVGAARGVGLDIRTGVHTGEVERRGTDVAGIAVHIGARVAALAGAGEVLVSGSVPPLVAGSGLEFVDRGEHELKGVPGQWRVFSVAA